MKKAETKELERFLRETFPRMEKDTEGKKILAEIGKGILERMNNRKAPKTN